MDYNILSNLQYCKQIVDGFQDLLLYSHVPSTCIALLLGIFVYVKNRQFILSKILIHITMFFAFWSLFDLVIWLGYDKSSLLMFAWMPTELFAVPMFMLCLYFAYVYIYGRDLKKVYKVLMILSIVPILIALPTELNLSGFDIQECIAAENTMFTNYALALKILYALITAWIIIVAFLKEKTWAIRGRIGVLALGVIVFLYSFIAAGYISEITEIYSYEMYGLFGMIVFIGCLAYLIVHYKEFNVKLISAQALVIVLIVLVGSQFFFIQNSTDLLLTGISVLLAIIFGFYLVKGVQREIEHREQIEVLASGLESANEHLKELDKQKSEFVSFATHQLRAPLTAMKGYTSMILEGDMGPVSPDVRSAVKRLSDSSNTLTNVVDDYLNVSRIELGTMKYNLEKLDFKKLVASVIDELKPNIDAAGVKLSFNAGDANFTVNADKDKFRQVISNLIDNSIKYSPKGVVNVSLEKLSGNVRFIVKDNGVGISPQVMPRLFGKFTRADNANAVNIHGTGLGLFVAKDVVIAHGGKIWAESEGEGKGSRFIVELAGV